MTGDASWRVSADAAAVKAYFAALPLPVRCVARQLDAWVREEIPEVTVGIKWRVPFYALTGPVCYVSGAKNHVTFGIVKGDHVEDASGLLTGTGKSPIRKAIFKANTDVPEATVRTWLRAAREADETWDAPA